MDQKQDDGEWVEDTSHSGEVAVDDDHESDQEYVDYVDEEEYEDEVVEEDPEEDLEDLEDDPDQEMTEEDFEEEEEVWAEDDDYSDERYSDENSHDHSVMEGSQESYYSDEDRGSSEETDEYRGQRSVDSAEISLDESASVEFDLGSYQESPDDLSEEPEDYEQACRDLIAIVHRGEKIDADDMLRRCDLPTLYRNLRQQHKHMVRESDVRPEPDQEWESFDEQDAVFSAGSFDGPQTTSDQLPNSAAAEGWDGEADPWGFDQPPKSAATDDLSSDVNDHHIDKANFAAANMLPKSAMPQNDTDEPTQVSMESEDASNASSQQNSDDTEPQAIPWLERNADDPEDFEAACRRLVQLIYRGDEEHDVDTMLMRTTPQDLYRYLKQQYWYLCHTGKIDHNESVETLDLPETPTFKPSVVDTLTAHLQQASAGVPPTTEDVEANGDHPENAGVTDVTEDATEDATMSDNNEQDDQPEIIPWLERNADDPDDYEEACCKLHSMMPHDEEHEDLETLLVRTKPEALYRYLKQQYWYLVHTGQINENGGGSGTDGSSKGTRSVGDNASSTGTNRSAAAHGSSDFLDTLSAHISRDSGAVLEPKQSDQHGFLREHNEPIGMGKDNSARQLRSNTEHTTGSAYSVESMGGASAYASLQSVSSANVSGAIEEDDSSVDSISGKARRLSSDRSHQLASGSMREDKTSLLSAMSNHDLLPDEILEDSSEDHSDFSEEENDDFMEDGSQGYGGEAIDEGVDDSHQSSRSDIDVQMEESELEVVDAEMSESNPPAEAHTVDQRIRQGGSTEPLLRSVEHEGHNQTATSTWQHTETPVVSGKPSSAESVEGSDGDEDGIPLQVDSSTLNASTGLPSYNNEETQGTSEDSEEESKLKEMAQILEFKRRVDKAKLTEDTKALEDMRRDAEAKVAEEKRELEDEHRIALSKIKEEAMLLSEKHRQDVEDLKEKFRQLEKMRSDEEERIARESKALELKRQTEEDRLERETSEIEEKRLADEALFSQKNQAFRGQLQQARARLEAEKRRTIDEQPTEELTSPTEKSGGFFGVFARKKGQDLEKEKQRQANLVDQKAKELEIEREIHEIEEEQELMKEEAAMLERSRASQQALLDDEARALEKDVFAEEAKLAEDTSLLHEEHGEMSARLNAMQKSLDETKLEDDAWIVQEISALDKEYYDNLSALAKNVEEQKGRESEKQKRINDNAVSLRQKWIKEEAALAQEVEYFERTKAEETRRKLEEEELRKSEEARHQRTSENPARQVEAEEMLGELESASVETLTLDVELEGSPVKSIDESAGDMERNHALEEDFDRTEDQVEESSEWSREKDDGENKVTGGTEEQDPGREFVQEQGASILGEAVESQRGAEGNSGDEGLLGDDHFESASQRSTSSILVHDDNALGEVSLAKEDDRFGGGQATEVADDRMGHTSEDSEEEIGGGNSSDGDIDKSGHASVVSDFSRGSAQNREYQAKELLPTEDIKIDASPEEPFDVVPPKDGKGALGDTDADHRPDSKSGHKSADLDESESEDSRWCRIVEHEPESSRPETSESRGATMEHDVEKEASLPLQDEGSDEDGSHGDSMGAEGNLDSLEDRSQHSARSEVQPNSDVVTDKGLEIDAQNDSETSREEGSSASRSAQNAGDGEADKSSEDVVPSEDSNLATPAKQEEVGPADLEEDGAKENHHNDPNVQIANVDQTRRDDPGHKQNNSKIQSACVDQPEDNWSSVGSLSKEKTENDSTTEGETTSTKARGVRGGSLDAAEDTKEIASSIEEEPMKDEVAAPGHEHNTPRHHADVPDLAGSTHKENITPKRQHRNGVGLGNRPLKEASDKSLTESCTEERPRVNGVTPKQLAGRPARPVGVDTSLRESEQQKSTVARTEITPSLSPSPAMRPQKETNASKQDGGRGRKIVVLLTGTPFSRKQQANQERGLVILSSSGLSFEVKDGANPACDTERNALFGISGLRGQYPQFFVQEASGEIRFLGDFDTIETMNDRGELLEHYVFRHQGEAVGKASPEIVESTMRHDHLYQNGDQESTSNRKTELRQVQGENVDGTTATNDTSSTNEENPSAIEAIKWTASLDCNGTDDKGSLDDDMEEEPTKESPAVPSENDEELGFSLSAEGTGGLKRELDTEISKKDVFTSASDGTSHMEDEKTPTPAPYQIDGDNQGSTGELLANTANGTKLQLACETPQQNDTDKDVASPIAHEVEVDQANLDQRQKPAVSAGVVCDPKRLEWWRANGKRLVEEKRESAPTLENSQTGSVLESSKTPSGSERTKAVAATTTPGTSDSLAEKRRRAAEARERAIATRGGVRLSLARAGRGPSRRPNRAENGGRDVSPSRSNVLAEKRREVVEARKRLNAQKDSMIHDQESHLAPASPEPRSGRGSYASPSPASERRRLRLAEAQRLADKSAKAREARLAKEAELAKETREIEILGQSQDDVVATSDELQVDTNVPIVDPTMKTGSTPQSTLVPHMVKEADRLSGYIRRYEKKLETVCKSLVSVAQQYEGDMECTDTVKELPLANLFKFVAEREWYQRNSSEESVPAFISSPLNDWKGLGSADDGKVFKVTSMGLAFIKADGPVQADVGRFLSSLMGQEEGLSLATIRQNWDDVARLSGDSQSKRVRDKIENIVSFCVETRLIA